MEFSLNLSSILTILGIAQLILLISVLLGLKRGYQSANRIFAAFLSMLLITSSSNILTNTKYILNVPHLAQVAVPFQFLIAPLFFLYIESLLLRKSIWSKRTLIHFIPFIGCLLYLLPFYIQDGDYKLNYLQTAFQNYPPEWRIRTALAFIQGLIYLVAAILMFVKYSRKFKNEIGSAYKINLYWVRGLLSAFSIIWCVALVRYLLAYNLETNLIVPLFISMFVYAVSFVSLIKPTALEGVSDKSNPKKYEKSALTPDKSEKYLRKLLQVMETEKPYLDSELTMLKLAERLSILPQHLSQIINEKTDQHFAEFINSYRVSEAKRKLSEPANNYLSIVAIAEKSGFSSKSVFNAAFKKHVQMTPSKFRKTVASKVKQNV